jgi:SAM-dependent methyltransferase
MLLHDLLKVDCNEAVYMIEPDFSGQAACKLTEHHLSEIVRSEISFDDVTRIRDGDEVIGIAIPMCSEDDCFLAVLTNAVCRSNDFPDHVTRICERAEEVHDVETTYSQFMDATIEYYAIMLVNRMLCNRCAHDKKSFSQIFSEPRVDRIMSFVRTLEESEDVDFADMKMLEICCGNGMATIALHKMGFDPFCLDSDRCAICEGIEHGVFAPHRVIVLDATELTSVFEAGSFDCITGFMLGAIYPFNKELWGNILSESVALLREDGVLLITVHKNEEIAILKEVLDELGVNGSIIDNRDDSGVYDQWIYLGRK